MQFFDSWHIYLSLFEVWLKNLKSASMRRVNCSILDYGTIWRNWHMGSLGICAGSPLTCHCSMKVISTKISCNYVSPQSTVCEYPTWSCFKLFAKVITGGTLKGRLGTNMQKWECTPLDSYLTIICCVPARHPFALIPPSFPRKRWHWTI